MIHDSRLSLLTIVFGILGFLLFLFLSLPLLTLIVSVWPARLLDTLLESEVWHSLLLTFVMVLWATLIGCVLGIPLAYLLARYRFAGKGMIEGLIDLPLMVPHSAAGIALLAI